jgi:hypothetical protein
MPAIDKVPFKFTTSVLPEYLCHIVLKVGTDMIMACIAWKKKIQQTLLNDDTDFIPRPSQFGIQPEILPKHCESPYFKSLTN